MIITNFKKAKTAAAILRGQKLGASIFKGSTRGSRYQMTL